MLCLPYAGYLKKKYYYLFKINPIYLCILPQWNKYSVNSIGCIFERTCLAGPMALPGAVLQTLLYLPNSRFPPRLPSPVIVSWNLDSLFIWVVGCLVGCLFIRRCMFKSANSALGLGKKSKIKCLLIDDGSLIPDTWHLTPETWNSTPDTWQMTP